MLWLVSSWPGRLLRAQVEPGGSGAMRWADSLFAAGDRPAARDAYQALLAAEPGNSHATFRLAQLTDDPATALRLYAAYVRLEPTDPWGYMAAGAAAARLGRYGDALRWYDGAAARAGGAGGAAQDVALGRGRVLERAGRTERAITIYRTWVASHPGDAEAWRDLGRQQLKAGRPGAAERSLTRSLALESNTEARTWLNRARALQAPAVQPTVGGSRDTDGNTVSSLGVRTDVAVADGARLGLAARHSSVADGQDLGAADALTVVGAWRARANVRLDWALGLGRTNSSALGGTGRWTGYPVGSMRLQVRAPSPDAGPQLDLRAQREALTLSPTLMANGVMRSEVSAQLSVPAGPIVLRGMGRVGAMTATPVGTVGTGAGMGPGLGGRGVGGAQPAAAPNWRVLISGAVAVPLGTAVEISGDVQRLTYSDSSSVGYFAPRLAELVEAGSYLYLTPLPPWEVELDVGAGAQREADHGAPLGVWRRALRLYAYSALELVPGSDLTLEIESYDAPLATAAATTSASWRWTSARLGLRWALH